MRRGGAVTGAGGVALAAALLLTGCGSAAGGASTYTPTVTVAPTSTGLPSGRMTHPATPVGGATPLAPTSSTATAGSTPTTAPSVAATANVARCAGDALRVTLTKGGDAPGTHYRRVVFTNRGSSTCVLRGAPAVSIVGGADDTQLGPAAHRTLAGAKTVRVAPGAAASAQLQAVNLAQDGQPLTGCKVVHGDGYRIAPPHSTRAFFVRDEGVAACYTDRVFMTVGPVAKP